MGRPDRDRTRLWQCRSCAQAARRPPRRGAIQIVSARIGFVTGRGLAANVKERFPCWVLLAVVGLLLGANTPNIAADIAAMAEAVRLLVGGSAHVDAVGFGMLCLVLQVFLPYETYVRWLKWLTLALLAYVAMVFSLRIDWPAVLLAVVWPRLDHPHEVLLTVVVVFGTTISPYLFFWQAAQELEGLRVEDPSARNALEVRRHLRRIKIDSIAGMTFSNTVRGTAVPTGLRDHRPPRCRQ